MKLNFPELAGIYIMKKSTNLAKLRGSENAHY